MQKKFDNLFYKTLPLAILFIPALIYILAISKQPSFLGFFGDDGLYFAAAKSLVNGEGYRIPFLPGEPFQTKYPPLYPLYLTAYLLLFQTWISESLMILVANLTVLFGCEVFFFKILRSRFAKLSALKAALLTGLIFMHPAFFDYIRFSLSEMSFLFFMLAFLWFADEKNSTDLSQTKRFFLMGLFAGLSYLTRSIGITLILTGFSLIALDFYLKKKIKTKLIFFSVPSILALIFWKLYRQYLFGHMPEIPDVKALGIYTYYLGYLSNLSEVIPNLFTILAQNITFTFVTLSHFFTFLTLPHLNFWQKPFLTTLVSLISCSFLFHGAYQVFKKKRLSAEIPFVLFYLGLVMIWPFEPFRFLVVLIPLFFVFTLESVFTWQEKLKFPQKTITPWLILVALIYGLLALQIQWQYRQQRAENFGLFTRPLDLRDSVKALAWARENLPRHAVVASVHPELFYHQTYRKAVSTLNESNLVKLFYPHELKLKKIGRINKEQKAFVAAQKDQVWREWQQLGVSHIWQDDEINYFPSGNGLNQQVAAHRSLLKVIYSSENSRIFEVRGWQDSQN